MPEKFLRLLLRWGVLAADVDVDVDVMATVLNTVTTSAECEGRSEDCEPETKVTVEGNSETSGEDSEAGIAVVEGDDAEVEMKDTVKTEGNEEDGDGKAIVEDALLIDG